MSDTPPAVIAVSMQPGAVTAFVFPLLPAAMTVAMPTERRLSMIGLRLSESQLLLYNPPPRLVNADGRNWIGVAQCRVDVLQRANLVRVDGQCTGSTAAAAGPVVIETGVNSGSR